MGTCVSNASLSVQELREDPSCVLGEPPHYSSQIAESGSEFPELIVGAWRVFKRKNGEALPVNEVCRLVGGALKAKREIELLRNQSIVDELTQVPNRRGIMEHLANEETRVQRYGGCLSVLFADLNYFKEINDTYGHKAGDLALITCAKTLQKVLRASDHVGRLGGDEFLGILPGVDLKEANQVAERMKQELEQTALTVGTDTIYLEASIGVASLSEGLSGSELLEKADERMYYSKRRFRRVQSLASLETSRRVANRLSRMV
jgi:diguanylate cyclase (GGDEF)-like protein